MRSDKAGQGQHGRLKDIIEVKLRTKLRVAER